MEVNFLLKVAGVGLLCAVVCLLLNRFGREEQAVAASLAGLVVVVLMLLSKLSSLIASFRSIFGF